MRPQLLTIGLFLTLVSFAQFNNPYRLCYDGSSYFVTNKGNGTVVKIDSAFGTSTVITGLYSPNDIIFGTFGGNSVLVVIDSNVLKLFDPGTFNNIWNVPITGVSEAHDAIYDPLNSNVFYVSDRAGNRIVKGVVGSAPFYPVTFSTLVSNIDRPAGMIYDNQGRLLVVSDTNNANIYELNTTAGSFTSVKSTTLNNLNDIAQDAQNNYYVTCWGDDKVHRFNSSFGEQTSLAQYNNPSGLFANLTYDYLAMACFNCNKVEYTAFHLFSPLMNILTCQEDSFLVDFNPLYKGIGTYNPNNKFIAEMSDSNGAFGNPVVLGEVSTDTVPSSFKVAVPQGEYASSGYEYRLKSTSPVVYSYFQKSLTIHPQPRSKIHSKDSIELCLGSSITIGPGHDSTHTYDWSPGILVSDSLKGNTVFNASAVGQFTLNLDVMSKSTFCASEDELYIDVIPSLSIPGLVANHRICKGDTVSIGVDALPYIMNWDNVPGLNDPTLSNPQYSGFTDIWIHLQFSDSSLQCSGKDSVFVEVDTLPLWPLAPGYFEESCIGEFHELKADLDTGYTYKWMYTNAPGGSIIIMPETSKPIFFIDSAGSFQATGSLTDPVSGCKYVGFLELQTYYKPDTLILSISTDSIRIVGQSALNDFAWEINGVLIPHLTDSYILTDTIRNYRNGSDNVTIQAFYYTKGSLGDTLCMRNSAEINRSFAGLGDGLDPSFIIAPNPAQNSLRVESLFRFTTIRILNVHGQVLTDKGGNSRNAEQMDVSDYAKGVYWIELSGDGNRSVARLIIR